MKGTGLALATMLAACSGCATNYHVYPVENPPSTVRYDHGSPTTSLVQRAGAVQVTPMGFDDEGHLVFAVAAYNGASGSSNFGIENIEAYSPESKRLTIYSVEQLIQHERNKAIAASVALALLGAAAAAASNAAAHQTYHGTFYTPHGAYVYKASYYDAGAAMAGTAASVGMASAGIYQVQRNLDQTIAGIGQAILQTTTIDPGQTVGGRLIVARPHVGKDPQDLSMLVRWNGEAYPFRFQLSEHAPAIPTAAPESAVASSASPQDDATWQQPGKPESPEGSVAASPPPAADRREGGSSAPSSQRTLPPVEAGRPPDARPSPADAASPSRAEATTAGPPAVAGPMASSRATTAPPRAPTTTERDITWQNINVYAPSY